MVVRVKSLKMNATICLLFEPYSAIPRYNLALRNFLLNFKNVFVYIAESAFKCVTVVMRMNVY